jgi:crotonobetainyl-CoA:carnitine CoA-transferase CaiB-like acyl-CoA transferase
VCWQALLQAVFLAELGADVVKIENGPAGGDVTRAWKLEGEVGINDTSAYYHSANYGKKVLMCDLKSESDKALINSYLKESEVIITNYQKATAEKLGISLNEIRKMNEDAIIVQLNAFEYDDPRPGYDLVMQAESGFYFYVRRY